MIRRNEIIGGEPISNIKELRNNMIVTEIPSISEFDLENCLEVIFKSNKNVNFYTFEYSRDNQTIYFYSDKEIDLASYQKFRTNRPVTKTSEVLKELRKVLSRNKTNDFESISLYDVFKVINQKRKDYEKTKLSFTNSFEHILKHIYGKKFAVKIYDFDYTNNMLKLSLDSKIYSDWYQCEHMHFSKVDGKICLSSEATLNSDTVLTVLGNHLSKLYDDLMAYKGLFLQSAINIATDSKFVINITKDRIDIRTSTIKYRFKYDFGISLLNYNGECKYDCDAEYIFELLNGKEKELFEKIFVKIEKCPKYLQKDLYEIRKEQLNSKSFLFSLKEKSLKLTQQFMSKIK